MFILTSSKQLQKLPLLTNSSLKTFGMQRNNFQWKEIYTLLQILQCILVTHTNLVPHMKLFLTLVYEARTSKKVSLLVICRFICREVIYETTDCSKYIKKKKKIMLLMSRNDHKIRSMGLQSMTQSKMLVVVDFLLLSCIVFQLD